jgi:hypothetical protein
MIFFAAATRSMVRMDPTGSSSATAAASGWPLPPRAADSLSMVMLVTPNPAARASTVLFCRALVINFVFLFCLFQYLFYVMEYLISCDGSIFSFVFTDAAPSFWLV